MLVSHLWSPTTTTTTISWNNLEQQNARDVACLSLCVCVCASELVCACVCVCVRLCTGAYVLRALDVSRTPIWPRLTAAATWVRPKQATGLKSTRSSSRSLSESTSSELLARRSCWRRALQQSKYKYKWVYNGSLRVCVCGRFSATCGNWRWPTPVALEPCATLDWRSFLTYSREILRCCFSDFQLRAGQNARTYSPYSPNPSVGSRHAWATPLTKHASIPNLWPSSTHTNLKWCVGRQLECLDDAIYERSPEIAQCALWALSLC